MSNTNPREERAKVGKDKLRENPWADIQNVPRDEWLVVTTADTLLLLLAAVFEEEGVDGLVSRIEEYIAHNNIWGCYVPRALHRAICLLMGDFIEVSAETKEEIEKSECVLLQY